MSSMLGFELFEITSHGRLSRYLKGIWKTIGLIVKKRPSLVVAQNPSVVLNLLLLVLRPLGKFVLVSDAHYGGVRAFNNSSLLQKILNYINSQVDCVIVTNSSHAEIIDKLGGNPVICQDPLPELPDIPPHTLPQSPKSVFLICAYATDEPYELVFKAFETLHKQGFQCFISGNYSKVSIEPADYPHLHFLGYLPGIEYWKYVVGCSVVVDLTEWDDCLVCGAYEAMAAESPLVLSDTSALREYFQTAAVYTAHTAGSIVTNVELAYDSRDQLQDRISRWKNDNNRYMNDRKNEILKQLQQLTESITSIK